MLPNGMKIVGSPVKPVYPTGYTRIQSSDALDSSSSEANATVVRSHFPKRSKSFTSRKNPVTCLGEVQTKPSSLSARSIFLVEAKWAGAERRLPLQ